MKIIKKYRLPIVLFLFFEATAFVLWLMSGNTFYLFNFTYIGFFVALGISLYIRGYPYARMVVQFADDQQAVVTQTNYRTPCYPTVQIIRNQETKPEILNLSADSDSSGLSIQKVDGFDVTKYLSCTGDYLDWPGAN